MSQNTSHSFHLVPPEPKSTGSVTPAVHPSISADNLKLLLVDSDPHASAQLEQLCRDLLGNRLAQLATADSVAAAAARMVATVFDIVLLDPQSWRTEELLRFRALGPRPTIIVSASTDLAVAAFEWGVLDFVPKPVNRTRLEQALHRAAPLRPSSESAPVKNFLASRHAGRIDFLALDDLLYVKGDDKYSKLVYANGRRHFHDKALGRLEAALPESFVRIHKSYLVRFTMVSRLLVLKGSRYFAELHNGLRLPVGRSRYRSVKSRLLWPPASS